MADSFTPGKWERTNSAPYSIWCGPTQIASTRWVYDNGAVSAECEQNAATAEANARLIAAAPELVAALRAIADIENEMNGGDWDEIERAREMARAALAKVSGA